MSSCCSLSESFAKASLGCTCLFESGVFPASPRVLRKYQKSGGVLQYMYLRRHPWIGLTSRQSLTFERFNQSETELCRTLVLERLFRDGSLSCPVFAKRPPRLTYVTPPSNVSSGQV